MKKLLLGAILTLFPILASAQFSIDKVDEFTGDTIVATTGVVVQRGFLDSFVLNLKHCMGKDFIGCGLTTNKCYNIFGDESLLYIKFSDGTIRKAICYENATAKYTIISNVTLWNTSMIYTPEDGMLEDLATKDIAKYRYETSIGYFENDVKPKKAKELKQQTIAFLSRMSTYTNKMEAKYKNGDYVWVLKDGKPRNYQIVSTSILKGNISYMLQLRNSWDTIEYKESDCYPSKEAIPAQ
ncbi:hypothetical protein [Bacteroides finegoldii]|uniref:hypothetical protein n=1 Tax=Bacteroides finegoldii TaxID=338188 RepID=UPI001898F146|nr:hypothetical protein [Bacteroides finegoldii]